MSSIHPALISIRVKIGARRNHYGFSLPTDGTKWLVCAWKKDKIFITGWVWLIYVWYYILCENWKELKRRFL